jgi:hypothetical protein
MLDEYNICARQLDITDVVGETNFSLGVSKIEHKQVKFPGYKFRVL